MPPGVSARLLHPSLLLLDGVTDALREPARTAALSRLLGVPPLLHRDAGRPLLLHPPGATCSFSRRDGWMLVGTGTAPLGVDLERVRPDLPLLDVAAAMFAPAEARALRSLPPAERALAFTAAWTVKEAALKASGRGITGGMHRPCVDSPALAAALRTRGMAEVALPGWGRGVVVMAEAGLLACRVEAAPGAAP